jgi:hypothetical protein
VPIPGPQSAQRILLTIPMMKREGPSSLLVKEKRETSAVKS